MPTKRYRGFQPTFCPLSLYLYDASGNRTQRSYTGVYTGVASGGGGGGQARLVKDSIASVSGEQFTSMVFPNPTSGLFSFKCSRPVTHGIVNELSLEGRTVAEFKYDVGKDSYDIRGLACGTYTVQLLTRDYRYASKLIKN